MSPDCAVIQIAKVGLGWDLIRYIELSKSMGNKNFLKNLIFCLLLLITFGCVTNKQAMRNKTNNFEKISEGMSYADVIQIWGEPDIKEILDNHREMWTYKPKFLSLHTRKLVLFENGVVVDHEVQYK